MPENSGRGDNDEARTEQVTAELLAGSVSKMSLAREVLRLKQLRDELVAANTNDLSSLRERAARLEAEISAEEETAQLETVELAEQVALAREELLAAVESEKEAREQVCANASAGQPDTSQAWTAGEEDVRGSSSMESGDTSEDSSGWKGEQRFDARFIKKVLDAKKRLAETSIEFATPLERTSGHVKNYIRNSKCRIQIISDRIDTIAPQRPIHDHLLALLHENAALRIAVNEYTEGLLAETFLLLDAAPAPGPTPR